MNRIKKQSEVLKVTQGGLSTTAGKLAKHDGQR